MTRDAVDHVVSNIDGQNGARSRLANESADVLSGRTVTRPQTPDVNALANNFDQYFQRLGDGRYSPKLGVDGGQAEALAYAKLNGGITILHNAHPLKGEQYVQSHHFDMYMDPNHWLFQDRVRREALQAELNGPSWADRAADRARNLVGNAVFGNPSNFSSWDEYMNSARARTGRWAVVGVGLAVAAFAGYEFLKDRTDTPDTSRLHHR